MATRCLDFCFGERIWRDGNNRYEEKLLLKFIPVLKLLSLSNESGEIGRSTFEAFFPLLLTLDIPPDAAPPAYAFLPYRSIIFSYID